MYFPTKISFANVPRTDLRLGGCGSIRTYARTCAIYVRQMFTGGLRSDVNSLNIPDRASVNDIFASGGRQSAPRQRGNDIRPSDGDDLVLVLDHRPRSHRHTSVSHRFLRFIYSFTRPARLNVSLAPIPDIRQHTALRRWKMRRVNFYLPLNINNID